MGLCFQVDFFRELFTTEAKLWSVVSSVLQWKVLKLCSWPLLILFVVVLFTLDLLLATNKEQRFLKGAPLQGVLDPFLVDLDAFEVLVYSE